MKLRSLSCAALALVIPAALFAQPPPSGREAALPELGLACPGTLSSARVESRLTGDASKDASLVEQVNRFVGTTEIDHPANTPRQALDVEAKMLAVTIDAAWCGEPSEFAPQHWTRVSVSRCIAQGEGSVRKDWTYSRRIGERWVVSRYAGKLEPQACPSAAA